MAALHAAEHAEHAARWAERRLDHDAFLDGRAVAPVDGRGVLVECACVGEAHGARERESALVAEREDLAFADCHVRTRVGHRVRVLHRDRKAVLADAAIVVLNADQDLIEAVVGVDMAALDREAAAFLRHDHAGARRRVAPEDGRRMRVRGARIGEHRARKLDHRALDGFAVLAGV